MQGYTSQNRLKNESANAHTVKNISKKGNIVEPKKSEKIAFLDEIFDLHAKLPSGP